MSRPIGLGSRCRNNRVAVGAEGSSVGGVCAVGALLAGVVGVKVGAVVSAAGAVGVEVGRVEVGAVDGVVMA